MTDPLTEALADRDRARRVAVALEQQLAAVTQAYNEYRQALGGTIPPYYAERIETAIDGGRFEEVRGA